MKKLIDEAYSIKFLNWLKSFTGEEIILPDPELVGGGIHSTVKGGFLKIHADFNWNKRLKLYRKLNLLIYLNKKWNDEWGGDLELWSKDVKTCEKKIIPIFNKTCNFFN
ncbi:2OG-Fe(II) oxygenase [Candidatus Pelagibacter sp. Uisw_114]